MNIGRFQSLVTKASLARIALGATLLYWAFEAAMSAVLVSGRLEVLPASWIDFLTNVESSYTVLGILTAVLFIIWSYAAHANLAYLGREGIRHQNRATIWWWLCPIANLFMPYRVVFETVRGSTTALHEPHWRYQHLPWLAGWWTGLFISGQIVSQTGNALVLTSVTELDLRVGAAFLMVGSILMTCAALAALVIVAKVTEAQAAHAETLAQGHPSGFVVSPTIA